LADSRQVGGGHYKSEDGGEEHWTRQYRLFGPGYFIGCITKYVERYQNKNGTEDLEKAKHFLEKLIELETAAENEGLVGYVDQDRCSAPTVAPAPTPRPSPRKRR
jgi:hypothetical protein